MNEVDQVIRCVRERKHAVAFSRDWSVANPPDHPDVRIDELDRVLEILREVTHDDA